MKKRILGILLTLCMALCFVPTAAFAATFGSDWTDLATAVGQTWLAGGNYYLSGDLTITGTINIESETPVVIDLNGHVLKKTGSGKLFNLYGGGRTLQGDTVVSYNPGSALILQDSDPTAVHEGENAALPAGGVVTGGEINAQGGMGPDNGAAITMTGGTIADGVTVLIEGSGRLTLSGTARVAGQEIRLSGGTLYANGGTVDCAVNGNGRSGAIRSGASTVTAFYGSVSGVPQVAGGMFYQPLDAAAVAGKTVTFQSDGQTYAVQVVQAGQSAIAPDAPERDDQLFTGWRLADGTKYSFAAAVNEDLTLHAGWFDLLSGGTTPQLKIGADNFWYVSYDDGATWTSLGVKATGDQGAVGAAGEKGEKGDTGATGEKGETGEKGDTGEKGEKGDAGADGLTPVIGENGNWWIGTTDTGIRAIGEKGAPGADGQDGVTPILMIDAQQCWRISYDGGQTWEETNVKAVGADGQNGTNGKDGQNGKNGKDGKDGRDGADGKDGKDGVGIAKAEINAAGELIFTYTDGNVVNLGTVVGADGQNGLTPVIGENGNWWIGEQDTGVRAEAPGTEGNQDHLIAVIAIAAAGVALAGNLCLALAMLLKRKTTAA